MPTYQYECFDCVKIFSKIVKIDDRKIPQECPTCKGTNSEFRITAVGLSFSGDGWATKNGRINAQMRERRQKLTEKSRERQHDQPSVKLAPNVGGERVDSWSDAKNLARDRGKDTSSYNAMIRKEVAND